jgi:hypothetical protein
MIDPDSRYASVERATFVDAEGREVRYLRRRFLPRGGEQALLAEVVVHQGDRLDGLAARTLGDATQSWRIADANDANDPWDLLEVGRRLRVGVPGSEPPR